MAKRGKGRWQKCESRKAVGTPGDCHAGCDYVHVKHAQSQSMELFQVLVLRAQWGFITQKTPCPAPAPCSSPGPGWILPFSKISTKSR